MTEPEAPLERLRSIMERLRDPDGGCPWDLEQTFETVAPYTIEEAYEVDDAIRRGDMAELKNELGDLLLQVVFHARMAEEAGLFDLDDVANAISDKMISRHPHVFGDKSYADQEAQTLDWERLKATERKEKTGSDSLLDDVPLALPGLKRAQKLQKRAATVGFDWPDASRVLEKVDEELAEVREAIDLNDSDKIEDEIGDLLFVCTNLARKLKVDSEAALRRANAKFERRFRYIEKTLKAQARDIRKTSLDDMEALWVEAKDEENR
ncbi:nucleoside triphosphate pyrophosphohydrolase [Hyphobacterium sp. CCMP332]|uniref:nucleoside triphosphate pyrophosphohydrolase n=1 Tax=Hyphobacterium sp. CCMP332 TaxID=2749086 RepID=UPI00164F79CF|nr:nucleoside triphosphate pyrophosphohydrolase [Hyphobacterium sp. CCMP332]QNL18718.1 nucleoside triphosphate pyrophosphohydrolase [Hyphobacterium sp. CCMP332]